MKQRTVTEFDRTTSVVVTTEPDVFDVEISVAWSSLVGPHGGYLAAIASTAAAATVPDRRVRTVSTTFLRPGRPGRATARTRVVRRGRSVSAVAVDLEQDDRILTSSRLTLVADVTGAEWGTPAPLSLPPPGECVRIDPRTPVAHFDRVDGLLDPASLPFSGGNRAVVQGYLRPIEARPIDAAFLAMATDWFPPPAFVRIDPPQGGVSVDLTTHVHRTIEDDQYDWLTGRFEIETSTDGLAVEHGVIRTLDGVLLAESFQTRWIAGN